jgi:hypothetical protein
VSSLGLTAVPLTPLRPGAAARSDSDAGASPPQGDATTTKENPDMEQINLIGAKGGQGTSVAACAVALKAAGKGRLVRLDGHDRATLAAILGRHGDGPVSPGLTLGADTAARCDLVVHDGPAAHGTTLLVIRPCYLALRRALNLGLCAAASGVVVVTEPGRALGCEDVAAVTGLPVIATIPLRADIARVVDAGVLADRLPNPLATAADQIFAFVLAGNRREVA